MTNLIGNMPARDLAGRDINHYTTISRTPMTILIEQYRSEVQSDQNLANLIEKLEHYFSNEAAPDGRDLTEKLESSDRADLLADALKKKEKAYKLIMRNQGSKTAQMIFAYILAEIVVNFEQAVRPLIQSNESRVVVDKAILENVLTPAFNALEDNPLMLDKVDIQSFLYFLGGNCYVRWDAC